MYTYLYLPGTATATTLTDGRPWPHAGTAKTSRLRYLSFYGMKKKYLHERFERIDERANGADVRCVPFALHRQILETGGHFFFI